MEPWLPPSVVVVVLATGVVVVVPAPSVVVVVPAPTVVVVVPIPSVVVVELGRSVVVVVVLAPGRITKFRLPIRLESPGPGLPPEGGSTSGGSWPIWVAGIHFGSWQHWLVPR